MNALEARSLTQRYGGFTAVDAVDLDLAEGTIRGLIGPNGAGKSSLIDALSGRSASARGEIRLQGTDIARLTVQQRRALGLARSFQRVNVFPGMTVRRQLEVAARVTAARNVDEVVSQMNLEPHLDTMAGEISYGHQRRLDLALALVGEPKVLLLDEPSAGLTAEESRLLAATLKNLTSRAGVSVLIVEHDMEVVFSICAQLTVLHLGKVLAEGPPELVRKDPQVISAYLGTTA